VRSRGSVGPVVLAAGLGAVPALALGLGRFGYALILPAMRSDLHWSYLQASSLTASNAAGYLIGALVAARAAARWSAARSALAAALVCATSLGLCAVAESLPAFLTLRLVAGVSGGVAFVAAAGLVAHLAQRHDARAGQMFGAFTGGAGIGIVLAAAATPGAHHGWRSSWAVLGLLGIAATGIAALTLRLLGTAPGGGRVPAARLSRGAHGKLRSLALGYGMFGAGYIGYMTFIVALLRAEQRSTTVVLAFWIVLGAATAAASPLWAPLVGRGRPLTAPALTIAVCGAGALLPAVMTGVAAAIASAVVFGGSFFAVVAAVNASARTLVAANEATAAIGLLTVSFAIGQSLGPVFGGAIADTPAGLRLSLALAGATLLATAAVLAAANRPGRALSQRTDLEPARR
jgi:predicted MFS family arabinose efflux permease